MRLGLDMRTRAMQGAVIPADIKYTTTRDTYFSLHVFSVQFAYIRAAGSVFARNPTRWGGLSSAFRPSVTSASSPRATEAARTTLHDAGPLSGSVAMMKRNDYENLQVEMGLFAC